MSAYPNPTQSQLDRIARANLEIAGLIGTFESSILDKSAELTHVLYMIDAPGLVGMRLRMIEIGNACADAGLVVHDDDAVPGPERTDWSNTADWEQFALVFRGDTGISEAFRRVLCRTSSGGMQTAYQDGARHVIDLDNVQFRVEDPERGCKWGVRSYNVSGTWKDVDVRGMGLVTRDDDGKITYLNEGHAIYVNPRGLFELAGGIMQGNGGQAYQEATRPHLGSDSVSPRVGLTFLHDTRMIENGYLVDALGVDTIAGGDRSSDPVSINGGGEDHNVILSRLTIETLQGPEFAYSGGMANSRGAIKLLADSWTMNREELARQNGVTQDHGEPPWKASGWAFGSVEVTGCIVRLRQSDRAALFLRGANRASITDNLFEDQWRQVKIELDPEHNPGGILPVLKDGTPLQPSGRIEWFGNTGDGEVRYRGVPVGPITGSYVFENGERVS